MSRKLLSISILTLTYNTDPVIFKKFLKAVNNQVYPKDKIEHLIIDGGSTNGILKIAKEFDLRVFTDKSWKNKISLRQSLALKKSKNDLVLWLPSDNILNDEYFLQKLVIPFIENPEIIASYTFHYFYNPESSLLNRYCSLMGLSDPVVYYFDKADRRPWFENRTKNEILKKKNYSIVQFNKNNLPTVGDNGFMINRKILLKAKINKDYFFHTDVFIDLIDKGYNKFALVYNTSVEHVTGKSFKFLIKRRIEYMSRDSDKKVIKNRRYQIINFTSSKDILNLLKFVFFTLTFVEPIFVGVRGFIKKRDLAWFVHPFICFLFLIYYGKFTLAKIFNK